MHTAAMEKFLIAAMAIPLCSADAPALQNPGTGKASDKSRVAPVVSSVQGKSPVRRFAADSFWKTVWTRGYEKEEALFTEPRSLALSGGSLLVLDQGLRELHAVDRRTGVSQLKLEARNGSGPGEFRRPAAVVAAPGGFAVIDQSNARLTAYDLQRRVLWDTPLPEVTITSLCIRANGTIVWKRDGAVNALETTDTSGRKLRVQSLPWRQGKTEALSTGARAAGPSLSGHCVMAREFGGHFAVITAAGEVRNFPYVEPIEDPVVTSTSKVVDKTSKGYTRLDKNVTTSHMSGMDAMIVADTLIVRFGGNTKHRIRLLDYYRLPTGEYLYSRKLPGLPVALTVGPDGTFYAAEVLNEVSGIAALRPTFEKPKPAPAAAKPIAKKPDAADTPSHRQQHDPELHPSFL